jgi:hypothetical protein
MKTTAESSFTAPGIRRKALAVLAWSLFGIYFLAAALVLVLQYAVLPSIESYAPEL